MKGNKMSAILAILLMLSGAVFVPHAFAQPPAGAVQCYPGSIVWQYPAHAPGGPGDTWTMYADVVDVQNLFSIQIGFYFDPAVIQILTVSEGGFLSKNGTDTVLAAPGSIDNVLGVVNVYGWTLTNTANAKTSPNHGGHALITVTAKINPALWPPYSGVFPGSAVPMMDLTELDGDPAELVLLDTTLTEISPLPANVYDGMFTLSVVPHGPTAAFTITPQTVYLGASQTFDASGSLPGWSGFANVPIVNYHWDFADGNITDTAGPITSHVYGATGTYTVFLTVTDANALTDTISHDAKVIPLPVGCNLDLTSQNWRYIDPITLQGVPNGALTDVQADLFRPGDFVQLFANTTYGGDAVQHQLVSFEVLDNDGNVVLAGTAFSDANGIAEYDFRVPWPCTGVEDEFGLWTAIATWQIGDMFPPPQPPFEKTQIDHMPFLVGWGLWIHDIDVTPDPAHKCDNVVVKIHVENDYMVPVTALATADIYDDLLVPIDGPAYVYQVFNPGLTLVTFTGIHVEKWAFVGTGTAKTNVFTTWPVFMGTSFCPEVTKTFQIKK